MKCLIAVFVGRFALAMADPDEVPIPYGTLIVKAKNGMRLRLEPVEGW